MENTLLNKRIIIESHEKKLILKNHLKHFTSFLSGRLFGKNYISGNGTVSAPTKKIADTYNFPS